MKIELGDKDHILPVQLGSVRISAYLEDGKTVLIITALNNADFIHIQPSSSNQVALKTNYNLI
jgi:hypothetical protein